MQKFTSTFFVVLTIVSAISHSSITAQNSSSSFSWEQPLVSLDETTLPSSRVLAARSVGDLLSSNQQTSAIKPNNSDAASSLSSNSSTTSNIRNHLHIQVSAIHVDKSEFPLSRLLFKLTLRLALENIERKLASKRIKISVNVRSANTCSRQYAGALAAEEYYTKRARLFIVSGCDDAIRAVSRLASGWRVPVMTAAGFGLDLSDKSVHRTLVRVAFSLKAAVEFLFKIMRSFQWRRFNLIVDESDTNSLALKGSIEKHIFDNKFDNDSASLSVNTISLDLQSLINLNPADYASPENGRNNTRPNSTTTSSLSSAADKWPNEITELAVRDCLRQSSLYSRVNVLLIPQNHLRRFMLSVYDQNMANGMYTFINMPLLLVANEDQVDNSVASNSGNYSKQSYATSTGDNVFIWRSVQSTRNSHAKQAFESLMSIYLKSPTTKAYIYFASKLSNLANTEFATTTTTESSLAASKNSRESYVAANQPAAKVQLYVNPYSASFYDCIQIYGILLDESLQVLASEIRHGTRKEQKGGLHSRVSEMVRNRRFDNMLTGTISINSNGDRETDYTLDDMNQMTGKFVPVILFRGETRDIERLSRIQWSSDSSVGPTVDNVDCSLTDTCPSRPWSKFLVTLLLLAAPLITLTGLVLYVVHNRIRLESQLVDYWWRIDYKEIEIIASRRKNLAGGSSIVTGADQVDSQKSSLRGAKIERLPWESGEKNHDVGAESAVCKTTIITRGTETSAWNSSGPDVCYGDIVLGIYKLNKVALKPISKFHQSRKMMIEIRGLKEINHNNLCRFIGIVVDELNKAIVSEYCPKGSLREFFRTESLIIDWTFRYSIINDIMAGLMYLHSSPLEFHGRLKSSNCLVSSRFVVKLSDFGPHSLYEQLDSDEEDEHSLLSKQLWMAPEHLKSGCKDGSKKGDVYSFGLLMYEVITNNPPFGDLCEATIDESKTMLNELKSSGPNEKIGPDLSSIDTEESNVDLLIALMKSCWCYDVDKRPNLMVVNTAIKKITKGITSKKLLENLTTRMEQYTNNLESLVDAKLATLLEEKLKAEELLYQFVPKSIALLLKEGQTVEPEAFDCVTVFYSDIVGFTSLSSESSPMEVIDFLSDLYLCFDETLEQHDIFKVDTIGDAYIVASGLPQRNDGKHVMEIACAALELRERLTRYKIPHKPDKSLEMRVGIHSGPCIAGIVGGSSMPKYCVFGDTLSIGKFMESNGLPMKIHITEESKNLLDLIPGFNIEPRTPKIKRDGLPYQTYWLERATG